MSFLEEYLSVFGYFNSDPIFNFMCLDLDFNLFVSRKISFYKDRRLHPTCL